MATVHVCFIHWQTWVSFTCVAYEGVQTVFLWGIIETVLLELLVHNQRHYYLTTDCSGPVSHVQTLKYLIDCITPELSINRCTAVVIQAGVPFDILPRVWVYALSSGQGIWMIACPSVSQLLLLYKVQKPPYRIGFTKLFGEKKEQNP